MTGEEKLNEFLEAIDEWVACKNIISPRGPRKNPDGEYKGNISKILGFTSDTLKRLTAEECLAYAYELHNYGEYLESVKESHSWMVKLQEFKKWPTY